MMDERRKDALSRVIERFPFNSVRDYMLERDWTWHDDAVPTVDQMVSCVRDLAESSRDDYGCSSGGFGVAFLDEHVTVSFGRVLLDDDSLALWMHSEPIR